jgi:hypothetical protein
MIGKFPPVLTPQGNKTRLRDNPLILTYPANGEQIGIWQNALRRAGRERFCTRWPVKYYESLLNNRSKELNASNTTSTLEHKKTSWNINTDVPIKSSIQRKYMPSIKTTSLIERRRYGGIHWRQSLIWREDLYRISLPYKTQDYLIQAQSIEVLATLLFLNIATE